MGGPHLLQPGVCCHTATCLFLFTIHISKLNSDHQKYVMTKLFQHNQLSSFNFYFQTYSKSCSSHHNPTFSPSRPSVCLRILQIFHTYFMFYVWRYLDTLAFNLNLNECIYSVVIILRMEAPWVGSHNWYILTKPRSETDLEKCPTDNVHSFIFSTKKKPK